MIIALLDLCMINHYHHWKWSDHVESKYILQLDTFFKYIHEYFSLVSVHILFGHGAPSETSLFLLVLVICCNSHECGRDMVYFFLLKRNHEYTFWRCITVWYHYVDVTCWFTSSYAFCKSALDHFRHLTWSSRQKWVDNQL